MRQVLSRLMNERRGRKTAALAGGYFGLMIGLLLGMTVLNPLHGARAYMIAREKDKDHWAITINTPACSNNGGLTLTVNKKRWMRMSCSQGLEEWGIFYDGTDGSNSP